MADFEIDVGFNTQEIKAAISEAFQNVKGGFTGAGGAGGQGIASSIGKGFRFAFVGLGIIGILQNLKVVLDLIAVTLSFISGLIALLVNKFIDFAVPFFNDFEGNSVKTAVKMINGILDGIEWAVNGLASLFTGGALGTGDNRIELPRFQEEIILEAFDELRSVEQAFAEGKLDADAVREEQKRYTRAWVNSFLKTEEFNEIKQMSEENNQSLLATLAVINDGSTQFEIGVTEGIETVKTKVSGGFESVGNLFDDMKRKADQLLNGTDITGPTLTTAQQSQDAFDVVTRIAAEDKKNIYQTGGNIRIS